jgi:hypothetical protein
MGNAQITPRERRNPVSVSEASSSQGEHVSMTRTHSVNVNASGLAPTRDETMRYLPKRMNRSSNHGVNMPSKPYGSSGPYAATERGIESPQWGWYIQLTPPTPDMYHSGSRPHRKKQHSSVNASQATSESATAASNQPNRIFQEMQDKRKGASMGWSSVPI